jgi:hypothetical protein
MTSSACSAGAMVEAMLTQQESTFVNKPLTKLQRCGSNLRMIHTVGRETGFASKITAISAEWFLNVRVSSGARRHESTGWQSFPISDDGR